MTVLGERQNGISLGCRRFIIRKMLLEADPSQCLRSYMRTPPAKKCYLNHHAEEQVGSLLQSLRVFQPEEGLKSLEQSDSSG